MVVSLQLFINKKGSESIRVDNNEWIESKQNAFAFDHQFTKLQLAILKLMVQGQDFNKINSTLNISSSKRIATEIYKKLGIENIGRLKKQKAIQIAKKSWS